MLAAHDRTLFDWSVSSFARYFATERFLFVVRDVAGTPDFVRQSARRLGIRQAQVVVLDGPTDGQAHTVELGVSRGQAAHGEPLTIFNIDTIRPGYWQPAIASRAAGCLEVFVGKGANWSYVLPASESEPWALQTAEKQAISDLCCTGLYHFATVEHFLSALRMAAADQQRYLGQLPERYVAPLYNYLIERGEPVAYHRIDRGQVTFVGIPSEYDDFLACQPERMPWAA
ncbi:MAG: hypothetical protein AB7O62_22240 [Pirellulales bacterium]